MKQAIQSLHPIDISLYFSLAMGLITIDHIITDNFREKEVKDKLDAKYYTAYKKQMNKEKGQTSRYIHEFIRYYNRTLKFSDGRMIKEAIPFTTAPVALIEHWVKKVLKMDKQYLEKVQSIRKLAYCSPVQLQGEFESHFRHWTDYRYIYISFIFTIKFCLYNIYII